MVSVKLRATTWMLCAIGLGSVPVAASAESWVGIWQTAPTNPVEGLPVEIAPAPKTVRGTLIYLIRPTLSGEAVRLRLSNEVGTQPLKIGSVSITAGEGKGRPVPVTFNGTKSVEIPAGAPILSDPISFDARYDKVLLVSVYLPEGYVAAQSTSIGPTRYVADHDVTGSPDFAAAEPISARPIVSAIAVRAPKAARAIVTLGDSITDGTTAPLTAIRGWPDVLAERLRANRKASPLAVMNAGIAGNRLLHDGMGVSALARFDRDVLAVPGVTHVLLLEGINDIGFSGLQMGPVKNPTVNSQMIIGAYRQIIDRAHARGLKIIGGTLLPFRGAFYFSEEKERIRQEVNAWIRSSGAFDGVVDFDKAMRDEVRPDTLKANADSGDHLHPNVAGHQMMAEAVDIRLFDQSVP